MDVRLGSADGRLTDEAITDLIEKVVDELDQLAVEPSIGTHRVGDDIDMTIGVVVDDEDEFEALRHGAAIISAGLRSTDGPGAERMSMPSANGLRSSTRVLQLA